MSRPGYLKLHRALAEKPIWKNSTAEHKVILIQLLMMADFKSNEWEYKGEVYKTQPGQLVTSLQSIADGCGKSVSLQNVRSALVRFERLGFLTNQSTKTNRLITIVNWEVYQSQEEKANIDSNIVTNREVTKDQQRGNKEVTTKEEGKKVRSKEGKNINNNYNDNRENNLYSAADLEEKTVSRRQVNQNLDNPDLKSVIEKYEQHGFGLPSGHTFYVLDESIKRFGKELTEYALKVADESGKRNIKYFGGILKNWEREGLKSKAEVIANENKRDRDSQATYKGNMRERQGESRPKWLDESESNTEKPEVEENPIDDAEFNKLLSFFKDREMTYEN